MSSESNKPTEKQQPIEEKVAEKLEKYHEYIKPLIAMLSTITPYIISTCQKLYKIYHTLAEDELQIIIGLVICFFGGVYPTLFAAIEAAKMGGWYDLQKASGDLADEAIKILEASKKDDDEKSDAKEVDSKAYIVRKANLVITKMNPRKVNDALATLYKVWLAVMAVLAIKFARTVAFAGSICKFLRSTSDRHLVPAVLKICPKEYKAWVPVLSDWATKLISVSIAFYITSIIVAFSSALTGALVITRSMMNIASKKQWDLGGLIPKDHKDTILDEISSYVIAVIGFIFQWKLNFSMPFPFNVVLFPFEMAEQFIRWSVTKVN